MGPKRFQKMNKKNQKRISVVGRRTGVDIMPFHGNGKERKEDFKDGLENFGDYWQSSDSSFEASHSQMSSLTIGSCASRVSSSFVKNSRDADSENNSFKNLHKQSSVGNTPVGQPLEKIDGTTNKKSKSKRLLKTDTSKLLTPNYNKFTPVIIKVNDIYKEVDDGTSKNSTCNAGAPIKGYSKQNLEEDSIEAAHTDLSDTLIRSSPSHINEKRGKFSDIQTSTAHINTHSVENSEVTSTTADFYCSSTTLPFCSLQTTPVKSSDTMIQFSTPRRSNRIIIKYNRKSFEENVLNKATSCHLCKENINKSGKNSELKKFTFQTAKQKKSSLSASPLRIKNDKIQFVSNGTLNEAVNTNKKEKTNSSQVGTKEIISSSIPSSPLFSIKRDSSPENSHNTMNKVSKASKSTDSKSQIGKGKKTLSASRNRAESNITHSRVLDCTSQISKTSLSGSPNTYLSSVVLNNTFSRNEVENLNRNEKINNSQVQIKEIISSSASLSLHNKMDRTQTFLNDISFENSHETMSQTATIPISTDSNTKMGKHKKTSSTSRNSSKSDEAEFPVLDHMSSSSGIVKLRKTSSHSSIRVENDENQSNVSNSAISRKRGNKNDKNKKSQAEKQNNSVSTSLSLINNEIEGTQIPVNNTFLENMASNKKNTTFEVGTSGILDESETSNSKQTSFKSKTGKRKPPLSVTSEMSELRRSGRERVAPLESWRLERRVFAYNESKEIVNIGYEQGFPGYQSKFKPTIKKRRPVKEVPKLNDNSVNWGRVQSEIEKIRVCNLYTGGEELIYLHRPYQSLLWTIPPSLDNKDPPYTISKCMAGELISFGYIEIEVAKKKKEQFSPSDNITFTVLKGTVKICINKQELSLKELDNITVPSGNGYSIKNTGKVPALISFCTYKFPLFDYQFSENSEEYV